MVYDIPKFWSYFLMFVQGRLKMVTNYLRSFHKWISEQNFLEICLLAFFFFLFVFALHHQLHPPLGYKRGLMAKFCLFSDWAWWLINRLLWVTGEGTKPREDGVGRELILVCCVLTGFSGSQTAVHDPQRVHEPFSRSHGGCNCMYIQLIKIHD